MQPPNRNQKTFQLNQHQAKPLPIQLTTILAHKRASISSSTPRNEVQQTVCLVGVSFFCSFQFRISQTSQLPRLLRRRSRVCSYSHTHTYTHKHTHKHTHKSDMEILAVLARKPSPLQISIKWQLKAFASLSGSVQLGKLFPIALFHTKIYRHHILTMHSVCTPSRAALQTGRLPVRSGMAHNLFRVLLSPMQTGGIPHKELTIAEILKTRGYRTGISGKWHLGINRDLPNDGYHLPNQAGYDSYLGFPLTNNPLCKQGNETASECFLYSNNTIIQQPMRMEVLLLFWDRVFFSPLTTHNSQLTTHHSPLTTHHNHHSPQSPH